MKLTELSIDESTGANWVTTEHDGVSRSLIVMPLCSKALDLLGVERVEADRSARALRLARLRFSWGDVPVVDTRWLQSPEGSLDDSSLLAISIIARTGKDLHMQAVICPGENPKDYDALLQTMRSLPEGLEPFWN